jgi:hypothetical protein
MSCSRIMSQNPGRLTRRSFGPHLCRADSALCPLCPVLDTYQATGRVSGYAAGWKVPVRSSRRYTRLLCSNDSCVEDQSCESSLSSFGKASPGGAVTDTSIEQNSRRPSVGVTSANVLDIDATRFASFGVIFRHVSAASAATCSRGANGGEGGQSCRRKGSAVVESGHRGIGETTAYGL